MPLIRDGDPHALATLCQRRAGAVYAYCEQVATNGRAIEAAANAFAEFRLALPASQDFTRHDAEALLRRVTRRAAARRGVNVATATSREPVVETCTGHEIALVRYAEGAVTPAVEQFFAEHVAQCGFCASALRRLKAGERAFERPPTAPLPLRVTDEIVRALVSAAPVRARGGDPLVVQEEALRLIDGSRPEAPEAALEPAPSAEGASRSDAAADPPTAQKPGVVRAPRAARVRRGRAIAGDRAAWRPRVGAALRRLMGSRGVILSAAAGAAFGLGLMTLTSDATLPAQQPIDSPAVASLPGATARSDRSRRALRAEVLSTVVHPVAGDPQRGARVGVHVRITNAGKRAARARRPVLQVGDVRVPVASVTSSTATSPVAALDAGDVAQGQLLFDLAPPVADRLSSARVRLRIGGRSVALTPVAGPPVAPT